MKKIILLLLLATSCIGMDSINFALHHDLYGLLNALLAIGLNPKAADIHGLTGLHKAAIMPDPRYTKLFLKKGVDPRCTNILGWSALHYATAHNRTQNIKLLIAANAPLNNPTNLRSKNSLLHLAARHTFPEATQLLLEAGADPCALNTHNQTPLHEVCRTARKGITTANHYKVAHLLIEHAIKKNKQRDEYVFAQDAQGHTAADFLTHTDSNLKKLLRPEQEINRDEFHAMLKKRGMNTIQFLIARETGIFR